MSIFFKAVAMVALAPLVVASLMEERNELVQRLRYLAAHDHLTGLPNRNAFSEAAQVLLGRLAADRRPVAMFMLDIDHFKAINDT